MKKLLIIVLTMLLIFSCAAFTACNRGDTAGTGGEVRGDGSGNNTGGLDDNTGDNPSDNSSDNTGGAEVGDNEVGAEYIAPKYDGILPQNYFGTYYLDEYIKVVDGKTAEVKKASLTDANAAFSVEKYNVTVFEDNNACLNFGGRADRRGVFNADKKTLSVKREYFSSMGSVEIQYDENLKFEFLKGELVLLKTTNGEKSQTLQVYNFKKGAGLTEADYPVTVNSFNGVYAEKHKADEDYIEVTVNGSTAKVERILHNGEKTVFDGAVVFRAEGDKYVIIVRYANENGTHEKKIEFDYALGVTSNYDKIR